MTMAGRRPLCIVIRIPDAALSREELEAALGGPLSRHEPSRDGTSAYAQIDIADDPDEWTAAIDCVQSVGDALRRRPHWIANPRRRRDLSVIAGVEVLEDPGSAGSGRRPGGHRHRGFDLLHERRLTLSPTAVFAIGAEQRRTGLQRRTQVKMADRSWGDRAPHR
ncbi:hypothetical protein [Bradyrhizobium sp. SZCCHNRI2007]|uniref:hypothetical protein n=1 Tax=Bradyrhizobium sp. SZCCHNRI2007 TaxID=3057281 RepID=UPI0028E9CD4B|nr:hypothetical protein [Bradyrhizobium sp. SZCCHNRI2007]